MLYSMLMRTTLNLDPEVLTKVRILAKQQGVSLGTVISESIRQALSPRTPPD
jgi:predicted HicB family RNase H-like nuclease